MSQRRHKAPPNTRSLAYSSTNSCSQSWNNKRRLSKKCVQWASYHKWHHLLTSYSLISHVHVLFRHKESIWAPIWCNLPIHGLARLIKIIIQDSPKPGHLTASSQVAPKTSAQVGAKDIAQLCKYQLRSHWRTLRKSQLLIMQISLI